MVKVTRQEWFSRPAETVEDQLVLAALASAAPSSGVRVIVEEPFGGAAMVGISFEGDSWEEGAGALAMLEADARRRAERARPLTAGESASPGEAILDIHLLGERRRYVLPAH